MYYKRCRFDVESLYCTIIIITYGFVRWVWNLFLDARSAFFLVLAAMWTYSMWGYLSAILLM